MPYVGVGTGKEVGTGAGAFHITNLTWETIFNWPEEEDQVGDGRIHRRERRKGNVAGRGQQPLPFWAQEGSQGTRSRQ